MGRFIDLTGQRFGRLTVIERAPNNGRRTMWLCKCDCGNEKIIRQEDLHSGKTVSCGCYLHERITKHGLCESSTYSTWAEMKDRCYNPNNPGYYRYGGRIDKPITVYESWRNDFEAFYSYVSKLPHFEEEGYTLNRIDNDGNYEPNNVEWADKYTQMNNTSTNHLLEYCGDTKTLTEWARAKNIPVYCLSSRIRRGWSVERALETPVAKKVKKHIIMYNGEEYSVTELSKIVNIPRTTLNQKINNGISVDDIIKAP